MSDTDGEIGRLLFLFWFRFWSGLVWVRFLSGPGTRLLQGQAVVSEEWMATCLGLLPQLNFLRKPGVMMYTSI